MARGQGRGRANQKGVIATSCCAVTCLTFFFLIGIPMLIASFVLFAIANGDYDDPYKYEHCSWSENYSPSAAEDCGDDWSWSWSWDHCEDCDDLQEEWDEWRSEKDSMRIAAIIMIIIALLSLVAGIVMALLMCTAMCTPSGGAVHSTQPQTVTMGTTQVTTVPQQQYHPQPVVTGYYPPQPPTAAYPMAPPSYDMAVDNPGYQPQPGVAYNGQGYPPQPGVGYPPSNQQASISQPNTETVAPSEDEHEYEQLRPTKTESQPAYNPDY